MAGAGQLADRAPAYFKCVAGGTKGEEFAHWSQAWEEAGALFTERERAALAWAETVTRVADTTILDDAYKAASAILAEKELVDLAIAIGLMNAYNRLTIMHTRDLIKKGVKFEKLALAFRQPPEASLAIKA